MNFLSKWIGLIFFVLLINGCGEREGLAPVEELTRWRAVGENHKEHRVSRGETLYSIAFRYDQDYRQLAALNHLSAPYILRVGQVLRLRGGGTYNPAPATRFQPSQPRVLRPRQLPSSPQYRSIPVNSQWLWPVRGHIVSSFQPSQGKKGIDIAGRKGDKIVAASSGVVAYAGDGLAGYGNLIIIKHNNQYLTAYGNNSRNLVREGQKIKAGQSIAEIGMVGRKYWGVHFEIRNAGQPVNPLNYLEKN